MMMHENLQRYVNLVLVFWLASTLLSAGAFFVIDNTLGDSTTGNEMQDIVDNIDSVQTKLENADNLLDYTLLIGYSLYHGIVIIISFLKLVLTGIVPIAVFLQIPAVVYLPIQIVIDCVVIYDFAKMLFNR